jgi:hypothetical protein
VQQTLSAVHRLCLMSRNNDEEDLVRTARAAMHRQKPYKNTLIIKGKFAYIQASKEHLALRSCQVIEASVIQLKLA